MGGVNFKETLIFDLSAASELVPYSPRGSEVFLPNYVAQ